MANSLLRADRAYERKSLIALLEADLKLVYALLNVKRSSPVLSPNLSLLEQALCTGAGIAAASHSLSSKRFKQVPVSTLAEYVRDRSLDFFVPVIAAELLSSLSLSLSVVQNPATPPSLVSHLPDPETTAEFLVRILRHPYETTELRNAVWGFVATAVESQAAFANLFVSGSFRSSPSKTESEEKSSGDKEGKGKGKATETETEMEPFQLRSKKNALEAAMETRDTWKELWIHEPMLLAAIVRFLNIVWHHAMEHTAVLDTIRKDTPFWELISWIITQSLGDPPTPPIVEDHFAMDMDMPKFSSDPNEMLNYTVAVATFAYQAAVKAYLVEILALDLALEPTATKDKSVSARIVKKFLGNTKSLESLLPEALNSSFDPRVQKVLAGSIATHFPLFRLESIQSLRPPTQRYYGDNYLFPCEALEQRLVLYLPDPLLGEVALDLGCQLHALNCNWSLTDAQIMLTRSWRRLLQESRTLGDDKLRQDLIALTPLVSETIAKENRSGGGTIMKAVHGERLGVLLAQLETAWLLSFTEKNLTKQFIDLLRNVHIIITSEVFRPIESLRSSDEASFHRTALHLACFCARKARSLTQESRNLSAEQCSVISSTMLAILNVVVDGLREIFDRAKGSMDPELDKDMELLVAVFEQCSRSELHTSPYGWLAHCQEAGLVRASLDLLSQVDIGGTELHPESLRSLRRPLYAKHILGLHLSLACSPSAAEMLVHEGALVCYSNNSITSIVSSGSMGLVHPELAGERNPGHTAWCTILAIVAGLVGSVTSSTHFIDSEITAFIQLYGAQLSWVLEWNVGMALSSAFLEELERTLGLFYSIALRVNLRSVADAHAVGLLKTFSIKALELVQHWSYALSHPNHLASLFEGVISDERRLLDKELRSVITTTAGIGGTGQFGAATELLEEDKRGFTASLVMRMHVICRNLVSTLVIASGGDEMLVQEPEDWPCDPQATPVRPVLRIYSLANMSQVTNVIIGAATVGTFIELGNSLVEVLQYVSKKKNPPKPSLPLSVAVTIPPFDVDAEMMILRQAVEMVAIYATTQLAMWHYQQTLAADFTMEEDVRVGAEWNDAEYGVSLERMRVPSSAIGAEVVNELQAMLKNIKEALDGPQYVEKYGKNVMGALENLLEFRVLR
jgi:nuclear pore complex protein Nup188